MGPITDVLCFMGCFGVGLFFWYIDREGRREIAEEAAKELIQLRRAQRG